MTNLVDDALKNVNLRMFSVQPRAAYYIPLLVRLTPNRCVSQYKVKLC